MPTRDEINALIRQSESYLTGALLPFWMDGAPDRACGGFLPHFDRSGRPTGETTKTYLAHIRLLYTFSSAHRAGYGGGRAAELARWGADFLLDHYWDDEHDGWFWIADREGAPTVTAKVGYGHCFGMYAFAEYALATGDPRGRQAAERTYAAVSGHMADTRYGGYHELMQRDWQPDRAGRCGGDRKSMDVHMHMMEALTTLYEMSGSPTHRRRLEEVIDLIVGRMLRPGSYTGYIQFTLDFTPLPAILFAVSWGRDAPPEDGLARPLDYTSYGHNVEFAWLLLHAADILGRPRNSYAEIVRPIFDHCLAYGIDWEHGGVLVEGPYDGPIPSLEGRAGEKQFWQQAEVMVGMLDAYALFGDEKYWRAFRNVYDFTMQKFVAWDAGGEWYERLNRQGEIIDGALGHGWKSSYHTVRAMVQTAARLRRLL